MNEGPHQRTSDIAADYEIFHTGGHSIHAVYTEEKPIHVCKEKKDKYLIRSKWPVNRVKSHH